MEITLTIFGQTSIAELVPGSATISDVQDALDLIGNCGYQGADSVIVHAVSLAPDFFELKTGIAGDILQKFSNYGMRLAIVGDFSTVTSNSLRDFMYESNNGQLIRFVASHDEAVAALTKN